MKRRSSSAHVATLESTWLAMPPMHVRVEERRRLERILEHIEDYGTQEERDHASVIRKEWREGKGGEREQTHTLSLRYTHTVSTTPPPPAAPPAAPLCATQVLPHLTDRSPPPRRHAPRPPLHLKPAAKSAATCTAAALSRSARSYAFVW